MHITYSTTYAKNEYTSIVPYNFLGSTFELFKKYKKNITQSNNSH